MMGLMELTLLGSSTLLLVAMWIALLTLAQARQASAWDASGEDVG
jgi:hypothetical protein